MRIAQIAPPLVRVPPAKYGGTERVVATLTEELVRRGHEVTLFASADSITQARLVPIIERPLWESNGFGQDAGPFLSVALGKVAARLGEFDVVHSHVDHVGYPLARLSPVPVITTLHGRLDLPELIPLYREFSEVPLVSISNAQRTPVPWANWVATIYHGVDVDSFPFNPAPGTYLAYLGRMSPEKGLDTAIRVARRTRMPLRVSARMPLPDGVHPDTRADRAYLEDVIRPLIAGGGVDLLDEAGPHEKRLLLREAAALLFPIQWPEPFGLVMIEALACGTPVIAFAAGSVPEVIDDGVTGFICRDEDAMVAAVLRLRNLDRAQCRLAVERRFSAATMAVAYEDAYARLLRHQQVSASKAHIVERPSRTEVTASLTRA